MSRIKVSIGLALVIVLAPFAFVRVQAQTTSFAYQGKLTDGGNPANGNYDLQFSLFDTATDGTQIGSTLSRSNTPVTAGVFTVQLDFGINAFPGADRFLEIGVKLPASPGFTTLAPRQAVRSTPYSIRTLSSAQADSLSSVCNGCILDTHINSIAGSKITGPVPATSLPPGLGVGWQIVAGTTQQAEANTNYIVTSDSEATITLPGAPNIGDTIRVSGAGGGGFRIGQNDGQSIRGSSLGWLTNWTPRETFRPWRGIASSADGQKLVAVEFGGKIYTSTDAGVSWTPHESNRPWASVASSADGSVLIAGAGSFLSGTDRVYTSSDGGVNWTPHLVIDAWLSVACSADGTRMVAAANDALYTSDDGGVNWTQRLTRSWSAVALSADGTKLVGVTNGDFIYTSTDLVNWTFHDSNRNWRAVASSADGIKLVAAVSNGVSFGQIYTSTDFGVTWTARDLSRNWISVASSADGNKLVAVVNNGQVYSSTDAGANWTPRETNRFWFAVTSSADGSKVAATSNAQIYTSSADTSPGTIGWLSAGPGAAIELQYIGGGLFMALSHEGTFTAH